ncbi:MAG: Type II secretion system protein F [uncultured bacterium]|nr:MAG: Type II secretion system protein F [uncultured bacterium]
MKTPMKIYLWRGTTRDGQKASGEIAAYSINIAKMHLLEKNIKIGKIQKKSVFLFLKKNNVSSFDLIVFFKQLSTLVTAGIPIVQAMVLLNQNKEQAKLFFILTALKDDMIAGNTFADSLRKFSPPMDEITCSLIYAGEKTGTLDILLERIAEHKETLLFLKNKIQQVLFYPLMTFFTAICITLIMLLFIVPRFAELFDNMHSRLPAFTLAIIMLSHFLTHYFNLIMVFLIAIGGLLYGLRKHPKVKITLDHLFLGLPGLGIPLQKYILSCFTRNLATLFEAGIPITEALKILAPTTRNFLYQNAIQKLGLDISKGQQLHLAMQTSKLFPPMMLQMVRIGEESGTLPNMLMKIAEFYTADINRLIGNLSRLLEPLIMLILGVLIGGLVIAMYLPIFKLGALV